MSHKKSTLIRKTWPKVREVIVKGEKFYQVDPRRQQNGSSIGGKRIHYSRKKDALAKAEELAEETFLHGQVAMSFDPELRRMAIKGTASLEPFGKTIADAVEHYLEFLALEQAKEKCQTVSTLVDLWKEHKTCPNRGSILRADTIDDINETSRLLKRNFGDLKILEVSKKHFEDYIFSLNVGNQRKFNLRSRFSQFFNWCINDQEVPIKNPLTKIKIIVPAKDTPILSTEETENLLRLCQKDFPKLLPYHVVSLFGGLRPTEAYYLNWEDINMNEKQIHVKKSSAKTALDRVFTMNDTLFSWLNSIKTCKKGSILNTTYNRGNLELFRVKLGYKLRNKNPYGKKWPEDVMRHSFASYWLRIHADKPRLAEIMGNSVSVIRKHYYAIINESDAIKYWQILP
jgi:integrase